MPMSERGPDESHVHHHRLGGGQRVNNSPFHTLVTGAQYQVLPKCDCRNGCDWRHRTVAVLPANAIATRSRGFTF